MTYAVGWANLALGSVYMGIGLLTIHDLTVNTRRLGRSHFGWAMVALAFTCGPHHVVHGVHLAAEGRQVGAVELASLVLGYPAAATWFLLRIETLRGGRGDRTVAGTPVWLPRALVGLALVTAAVVAAFVPPALQGLSDDPRVIPNLLLIGIYGLIGFYLGRGQLKNHHRNGVWSLSGMSLTLVFPTCALMHAAYALYTMNGTFAPDGHGLWVDWLSVPAGVYFLWVVRSLYMGTLTDWNRSIETVTDDPAVAAAV